MLPDFGSLSTKRESLDHLIGKKLWMVGRLLGLSPFDDSLTEMPIHQLDWILAMASKDNPESIKIVTAKAEMPWQEREAAWDSVLQGNAYKKRHRLDEQKPLFEAIERMRKEGTLYPAKVGALKPEVRRG